MNMYFMYLYKDYVRIWLYMYFKVSNFYQNFFTESKIQISVCVKQKINYTEHLTRVPSQPQRWFKRKPIMLLWLNIWSQNFDVIWELMELLGCVVYWTLHVRAKASISMDIHFLVFHLRRICYNFKISFPMFQLFLLSQPPCFPAVMEHTL